MSEAMPLPSIDSAETEKDRVLAALMVPILAKITGEPTQQAVEASLRKYFPGAFNDIDIMGEIRDRVTKLFTSIAEFPGGDLIEFEQYLDRKAATEPLAKPFDPNATRG